MEVPVTVGELCDRLAILDLKARRIGDPARRELAAAQARALRERWDRARLPDPTTQPEWPRLCEVHRRLWEVEDALRRHEAGGRFGPEFVELARSVYRLNDERAALKAAVDRRWGEVPEPKWFSAGAAEVIPDRPSGGS